MKVNEIILEARLVWARRGNKVSRKIRCTSGPRKGRIVSSPAQCHAPINVAKRAAMKRNKLARGGRMTRKAGRTKRYNPVAKRVRALNR